MENRELKSILQDALESKFPASQIDLLPKVREHLVAGTIQQGEKMNTVPSRRLSRLALAALAVVVLLTIAFVTPQGRAFAQSILQLFRRSDSYTLPLPEEQLSPTGKASAPTAMPPAPLVSIQAAEKMTGFDAKVLSGDPKGFTFAGAMASGDGISIQYQAQGNGGQLIINESNNGFMESDWDRAPAEFITPVKVGGLDAEVVQGAYVVYPGATNAQWNPEAPIIRLRWIEDGIWFEMAKFGGVESISYLDQQGMIALAESMLYEPGETPGLAPKSSSPAESLASAPESSHAMLVGMEEAKKIAGFNFKELPSVPQGMVFVGATASPASINLEYESLEEGAGTLSISQSLSDENWQQFPADAITAVQVGDENAELIRGAYIFEPGASSGTWNPDVNIVHLRWVRDGIWSEILMTGGGSGSLAHLDENGLIALAESLVYVR